MATANLSELVTRFGASDSPDADLLARFAASRDEAAFAELVRRHGGTVFGVCRRVTGNHHLAEDAFQAVFVVLATKAASLRPRSAVAAFLHGVAFRTSLRARTMADRRRRRESTVDTLPEVGTNPPEVCDAVALLDEAIAELPESLRLPVVLCELEGGTRAEVALRLGIPEGTLSSRLASARKVLAGRLRNRGVVLSAAGLSLVLGQVASASAPAGLAARAVAAAVTPGSAPGPVAELSSGVLRVMFLHKLKAVVPLAGLLAVALFAGVL
ncbi:MAG TPA: sigma-70 family RNA polymerase sigma factor, partial [Gemmataceae bacterium]|nr:sigma-70 family RNA polymerase sigma factor [Gemmataceae bacterium]